MAFTPPFVTIIQAIATAIDAQTTAIQNLEATVAAQAASLASMEADMAIAKNLSAYQVESFYGASPELSGIINPP